MSHDRSRKYASQSSAGDGQSPVLDQSLSAAAFLMCEKQARKSVPFRMPVLSNREEIGVFHELQPP